MNKIIGALVRTAGVGALIGAVVDRYIKRIEEVRDLALRIDPKDVPSFGKLGPGTYVYEESVPRRTNLVIVRKRMLGPDTYLLAHSVPQVFIDKRKEWTETSDGKVFPPPSAYDSSYTPTA